MGVQAQIAQIRLWLGLSCLGGLGFQSTFLAYLSVFFALIYAYMYVVLMNVVELF